MRTPDLFLASLIAAGLAPVTAAQTITVTTGADVVDVNASSATVADLPGADGVISFSEALIASNNTPGPQTIGFAIPESEWTLQFLYPGRAVLNTSVGFYWRAYDEVTIDGTTQTAFTGDTNPDGWEVVLRGSELYLNADNCTLLGFDSSSIALTGSFGVVEDNTSVNIDVYGGTDNLVRANTGGTIKIDRANYNVVVGNTVQRVRVLGGGATQLATGNRIGGPDPADRNYITGYGTWNSEGLPGGATVQLFSTQDTLIENNSIGTTPDGLAQGSQASVMGISFQTENHGTTIRNNRIAGILGHGMGPHHAGQLFGWAILVGGICSDVSITGNTIGLDANGEPSLGSVWGIDLGNVITSPLTAAGVQVGGHGPSEGNVIAGHILNGVTVGHNVPAVRLAANEIHDNGWLGIDLIPSSYGYGVSENDPLDVDTGGNGVQNFPVVISALRGDFTIRIQGLLGSSALSPFTLDFFASSSCDATGFGEGEMYLGSTAVSTDSAGEAGFDVTLPAAVPSGWFVTATATLEPLGATSEFSACVQTDRDPRPRGPQKRRRRM